jgi:predicted transcriptional regulator
VHNDKYTSIILAPMPQKVPCEIITWYMLPAIRRGLAIKLVQDYKCSQKQAAAYLGLTDAAVSQYLAKKRGKIELNELDAHELERSAQAILDGAPQGKEICRLCKNLISSGALERIRTEYSP